MANSINWGKIYCEMATNEGWSQNIQWSANAINDISAPLCWEPVRADNTYLRADSTLYTVDNLT